MNEPACSFSSPKKKLQSSYEMTAGLTPVRKIIDLTDNHKSRFEQDAHVSMSDLPENLLN